MISVCLEYNQQGYFFKEIISLNNYKEDIDIFRRESNDTWLRK